MVGIIHVTRLDWLWQRCLTMYTLSGKGMSYFTDRLFSFVFLIVNAVLVEVLFKHASF